VHLLLLLFIIIIIIIIKQLVMQHMSVKNKSTNRSYYAGTLGADWQTRDITVMRYAV